MALLYDHWRPRGGEQARDYPAYVERRLAPTPGPLAHEASYEIAREPQQLGWRSNDDGELVIKVCRSKASVVGP